MADIFQLYDNRPRYAEAMTHYPRTPMSPGAATVRRAVGGGMDYMADTVRGNVDNLQNLYDQFGFIGPAMLPAMKMAEWQMTMEPEQRLALGSMAMPYPVGDVAGLTADAIYFAKNPHEMTPGNLALAGGAAAAPFVPPLVVGMGRKAKHIWSDKLGEKFGPREGFYSALERHVKEKMQGPMSGPQFEKWLKKQPGLKQAELDAYNIDVLTSMEDKITPEIAEAWLLHNRPLLGESRLSTKERPVLMSADERAGLYQRLEDEYMQQMREVNPFDLRVAEVKKHFTNPDNWTDFGTSSMAEGRITLRDGRVITGDPELDDHWRKPLKDALDPGNPRDDVAEVIVYRWGVPIEVPKDQWQAMLNGDEIFTKFENPYRGLADLESGSGLAAPIPGHEYIIGLRSTYVNDDLMDQAARSYVSKKIAPETLTTPPMPAVDIEKAASMTQVGQPDIWRQNAQMGRPKYSKYSHGAKASQPQRDWPGRDKGAIDPDYVELLPQMPPLQTQRINALQQEANYWMDKARDTNVPAHKAREYAARAQQRGIAANKLYPESAHVDPEHGSFNKYPNYFYHLRMLENAPPARTPDYTPGKHQRDLYLQEAQSDWGMHSWKQQKLRKPVHAGAQRYRDVGFETPKLKTRAELEAEGIGSSVTSTTDRSFSNVTPYTWSRTGDDYARMYDSADEFQLDPWQPHVDIELEPYNTGNWTRTITGPNLEAELAALENSPKWNAYLETLPYTQQQRLRETLDNAVKSLDQRSDDVLVTRRRKTGGTRAGQFDDVLSRPSYVPMRDDMQDVQLVHGQHPSTTGSKGRLSREFGSESMTPARWDELREHADKAGLPMPRDFPTMDTVDVRLQRAAPDDTVQELEEKMRDAYAGEPSRGASWEMFPDEKAAEKANRDARFTLVSDGMYNPFPAEIDAKINRMYYDYGKDRQTKALQKWKEQSSFATPTFSWDADKHAYAFKRAMLEAAHQDYGSLQWPQGPELKEFTGTMQGTTKGVYGPGGDFDKAYQRLAKDTFAGLDVPGPQNMGVDIAPIGDARTRKAWQKEFPQTTPYPKNDAFTPTRGVKLTPEMKNRIKERGFRLFQGLLPVAGAGMAAEATYRLLPKIKSEDDET